MSCIRKASIEEINNAIQLYKTMNKIKWKNNNAEKCSFCT
jgi:hypothetical protein